jgi:hypothetical protein
MIDGQVINLCQAIQQLQTAINWWNGFPDLNQDVLGSEKERITRLMPLLEIVRLQYIHQDGDLVWRVEKIQNQLRNREPFSPASLIREFCNLYDQLMHALGKQKFAYIPENSVPFFEQDHLFGMNVYDHFPDLRDEIKDIGNAFASGLYSACVFHSMRVAEHGMRRVAKKLKVSLRDNRKPLEINYATWDKVINGIKSKLDRIRKNPKGPIREKEQDLYSSIADQCTYFRDIWRDKTMHSRKRYDEDEASRALHRIAEFMGLLAAIEAV